MRGRDARCATHTASWGGHVLLSNTLRGVRASHAETLDVLGLISHFILTFFF